MKSRNLLVAGLVAIGLGGCAAYPYDNYAYRDGYYPEANQPYREGPIYEPGYYGYVGPGYYVAPSIGFGITYSNRHYYGHRRHWW